LEIHKHVSLNLDIRGLGLSATLAINERVKELQKDGKLIYNFGLGQSPFPVPVPVVDALKLHAHEKDYLPVKGLSALREAVAEFHRKKDLVDARPENVLIGPGSKELMFLLQLVFYGELILPTPCWVSYVPQAKITSRHIRLIHTKFEDKWQFTSKQLAELCEKENDVFRPRILILNYPSNPTGCTYKIDELKKIAEIAKKYEILILSDEIYGQLHFKGEHVSIARFYPEGTIISSGLSKWCGAGGWRLGTFTFPENLDWLLDSMASVASETYTSVSAPIQFAAVRAFKGGIRIERYLWHARRILRIVGERCTQILTDGGIKINQPMGAFYLFLDFTPFVKKFAKKGILDSATLCEQLLLDTGVAVLPGVSFERPPEELTARLAYINFDGTKALAASETVSLDQELSDNFIQSRFEKTLIGAEKIVKWLNKMIAK
jgi:aspartate aminotransferase